VRFLRFSLFKLLVLFTIVAISLGVGGNRYYRANLQKTAIEALRSDRKVEASPEVTLKRAYTYGRDGFGTVSLLYDFESDSVKPGQESYLTRDKKAATNSTANPSEASKWLGVDFCHNISRVEISRECAAEDLKFLRMLPGIESLVLNEGYQTDEVGQQLNHLKTLESLSIVGDAVPSLENLKRLKTLKLSGRYNSYDLSTTDLLNVAKLNSLTTLQISSTSIQNDAWDSFSTMETVKELSWNDGYSRNDYGLGFLKYFPNLVVLKLDGSIDIDNESIEAIGSLTKLEKMIIRSNVKSKTMSKLHPLAFFNSNQESKTDEKLNWNPLSSLTKLKHAQLEFDSLTDDAIGKICSSNLEIEYLSIRKTNVGNRGMDSIERLSSLKMLRTGGNLVTRSGLEGLKTALPNCKVVWD